MELSSIGMAALVMAIAVVAFLYSSVGHAGASGYIAVLALFGWAAQEVKPMALVLNILVAVIGSVQFWRAGHFSWKLFWPFALLSVPAAYAGGFVHLPPVWYKALLGLVLLYSAVRFFIRQGDPAEIKPVPAPLAIGVGAGIGFLSGLTGTGGGIFLTPIMLFCRWAHTRQVAAVSVVFILVNSIAGLAGHLGGGQPLPGAVWPFAAAAVAGGALGSHFGSRRFPLRVIHVLLAVVLLLAGGKLLWEGLALLRGN